MAKLLILFINKMTTRGPAYLIIIVFMMNFRSKLWLPLFQKNVFCLLLNTIIETQI